MPPASSPSGFLNKPRDQNLSEKPKNGREHQDTVGCFTWGLSSRAPLRRSFESWLAATGDTSGCEIGSNISSVRKDVVFQS